ncbi:keratin, type II cytoskeletal I-like isoform X2 [Benincasa hispida]|uniref:keratin, type II cytoskeletal I-like isoform X2 n=1 Tax=Benincasa hispida TaxID=102211 RepID=UPI00190242FF|nr:keratin, type II cytoskeletal I-like isoform X2 [Benincasa hispida]
MGKNDTSQASIERRNWGKIFNGLTQMLRMQQNQLETLVGERKLLEDRVKMQHERWVADFRLYEDHISQMKDELLLQDMERSLQASKSDLLTGMKQTELYLYRLKIEHSEAELEDFKSFFDDLISHKNSNLQESSLISASEPTEANGGRECVLSTFGNTEEVRRSTKLLEGEVRRLRCEYEKLASEKSLEVSALVAEKKFVWNQYNVIENDFSSKLKSKQSELERAHLKIEKLLATLEQLQNSNNEKDGVIATLRNQVGNMETESCKLKDEISRLSHDLEVQRKSLNATATPVLNPCKAGSRPSRLGGKNGTKNRSNVTVNKCTSSAQPSHSGNQKKRGADDISDPGTPRFHIGAGQLRRR